jgi:hypothetical protein
MKRKAHIVVLRALLLAAELRVHEKDDVLRARVRQVPAHDLLHVLPLRLRELRRRLVRSALLRILLQGHLTGVSDD